MSKRKFSGNLGGKGYYIALVLCAVAIGVSAFFYYRSGDATNQELSDKPAVSTDAPEGLQAAATDPVQRPAPSGPAAIPEKPAKTVNPVAGETVAPYAMDQLSYNQTTRDWRVHNGVDIAAGAGTDVCAAADGTVYTVYEDETMGMTVVIRHEDGYTTRYASLAKDVSVAAGDTVTAGQVIGCVGNTALLESAVGDHLHFAVSCDGQAVDPADFLPEA